MTLDNARRWTLYAILFAASSSLFAQTITIDAAKLLRRYDRRMLIGTNVAMWNNRAVFSDPDVMRWFREYSPGLIRMPGGSWSDIVFWNGNGVRRPDGTIDHSQYKDNYPIIDYSAYAPSICVEMDWSGIRKYHWHGNIDVKGLHEFIKGVGCETMVTVNAGTGRAEDAAQWVKWANKEMGYNVKYWEVGNELDGGWEGGHYLPGGGELTAAMYAKRYKEFAIAMKQADPTIKVGGAADGTGDDSFAAAMLRDAGAYVDFVSWHTYPCQAGISEDEMFARATLAHPMASLRRLIRQHQPGREKEIEICLTEWNLHGDRTGTDLVNTLWSCIWIGEMVKEKMDFATQWDALTGYASLFDGGKSRQRRSQYWAFWLWRYFMGNEYISSSSNAPAHVYTLATRSNNAVYLMLVNKSREQEANITVKLANFTPAAQGEAATLSQREYFWNHLENKIEWNRGPRVLPLATGASFDVELPPFCVKFVKVPSASKPGVSKLALSQQQQLAAPGNPELKIQAPRESYAGQPIECWVRAYRAGTKNSYLKELPDATLVVNGARADKAKARLKEAAGRFFVTADKPGLVTLTATSAALTAKAQIKIKESVIVPRVVWDFEEDPPANCSSHYKLSMDTSQVANRGVARIDLENAPAPTDEKRTVLSLRRIPGDINRARIRGVTFKMKVEPGFSSSDADAGVDILCQSEANWWMPLGRIKLSACEGEWKDYTFEFSAEHQKAAYKLNHFWLVLSSDASVNATVYIDEVGFLIR